MIFIIRLFHNACGISNNAVLSFYNGFTYSFYYFYLSKFCLLYSQQKPSLKKTKKDP